MYSSSSISHVSFLSFLNNEARYLVKDKLKMAKNAQIRAKRLGRVSSSLRVESPLKMARRIELLIRRSLRPMPERPGVFVACRNNPCDRQQEYAGRSTVCLPQLSSVTSFALASYLDNTSGGAVTRCRSLTLKDWYARTMQVCFKTARRNRRGYMANIP